MCAPFLLCCEIVVFSRQGMEVVVSYLKFWCRSVVVQFLRCGLKLTRSSILGCPVDRIGILG